MLLGGLPVATFSESLSFKSFQGGPGNEPEPETGTVGTVFPGTESGTGTVGIVWRLWSGGVCRHTVKQPKPSKPSREVCCHACFLGPLSAVIAGGKKPPEPSKTYKTIKHYTPPGPYTPFFWNSDFRN